tara:strand:+ start:287 stop:448 length:162 start_codon:yes stop_codon:yes gene_type:complete
MPTAYTSGQTEAKIVKAIKGLALTQTKTPTKIQFVDDAIEAYITALRKGKYIK